MHITQRRLSMCDYSLHGIKNRLADEGETLVVHRFYTGSKGLTSPKYLEPAEKPRGLIAALKKMFASPPSECAVCIPDGAKLILLSLYLRDFLLRVKSRAGSITGYET